MEIGEDPEYISFLRCLRLCGNSHMLENQPDGVSSSIDVKYEAINPTCVNKPKRRIRHDSSANEIVMKVSGGERIRLKSDSVWFRKRRDKNEEGLSGRNLNYLSRMKVSEMGTVEEIGGEVTVKLEQKVDSVHDLERRNSSFEEERENLLGKDVPVQERMEKDGFLEAEAREKGVEKDAVLERGEEDGEIGQMGIASSSFENSAIQSENLQGLMLLMKMLCPVTTTIYPSFNSNEVAIGSMGDSSTSKNIKKKPNQEEKRDTSSSSPRGSFDFDWIEEKREEEQPGEEMKSRHKENKRGRMEMEGLAAFPELSDSDVTISFSLCLRTL